MKIAYSLHSCQQTKYLYLKICETVQLLECLFGIDYLGSHGKTMFEPRDKIMHLSMLSCRVGGGRA